MQIYCILQIESNHLKCIKEPPPRKTFAEVLDRFNANIEYSGLIHSVSEDVSYNLYLYKINILYFKFCFKPVFDNFISFKIMYAIWN